jgi:hypothetical protein
MPIAVSRALATVAVLAFGLGLAGCVTGPASGANAGRDEAAGLVGAWTADLCDRPDPAMACGSFVLHLIRTEEGLCGEHFVATPGAARLDEGDPGSVLGSGRGGEAVLVVRSGRNGALYMGRVQRRGAGLVWTRVGMVDAGSDDEPPILPDTLTLQRDDSPAAQERLRALGAEGCRWPSWMG